MDPPARSARSHDTRLDHHEIHGDGAQDFSDRGMKSPSRTNDSSPSAEAKGQGRAYPSPSFYANNLASSSTSSFGNFSRPGIVRNFTYNLDSNTQSSVQSATQPQHVRSRERIQQVGQPAQSAHSAQSAQPIKTDREKRSHSQHKRQHSQGFFEPSLPSASSHDQTQTASMSASQIAAHAAMYSREQQMPHARPNVILQSAQQKQQQQHQHQHQPRQQEYQVSQAGLSQTPQTSTYQPRQRSLTTSTLPSGSANNFSIRQVPSSIQTGGLDLARKPGDPDTPRLPVGYNGKVSGHDGAAATAASAAYPGRVSPHLPNIDVTSAAGEKEHRPRPEKSKMKLFLPKSKDKYYKESEKDRPRPSPSKLGPGQLGALTRIMSPSLTNLREASMSGTESPSFYMNGGGSESTSTLVPDEKYRADQSDRDRSKSKDKEKEPSRRHFLSRQKNKLRDRMTDDHQVSSPTVPNNSRSHSGSLGSSSNSHTALSSSPAGAFFTGLDIRHVGRSGRDKKREDKLGTMISNNVPFAPKILDIDRLDLGDEATATHSKARTTPAPFRKLTGNGALGESSQQSFNLQNLRPEDAWDILRTKVLLIFAGDEVQIPLEDLNQLVNVHVKYCFARRQLTSTMRDLQTLLNDGFQSLDLTLQGTLEQRLVPYLVEMWLFVFGRILPLLQAVFLPLDLELQAADPKILLPQVDSRPGAVDTKSSHLPGSAPEESKPKSRPNLDNVLNHDIRHIVLKAYRDNVIMPRHDALKTVFSRLSLESINAVASPSAAAAFETADSPNSNIAHSRPPSRPGVPLSSSATMHKFPTSSPSRPSSSSSSTSPARQYDIGQSFMHPILSKQPSAVSEVSFSPTRRSRGNSNLSARSQSDRSEPYATAGHNRTGSHESGQHQNSSLLFPSTAALNPSWTGNNDNNMRPSPLARQPTNSSIMPLHGTGSYSSNSRNVQSHARKIEEVTGKSQCNPFGGKPVGSLGKATDSSQVTETVGRILQCMSVLASLQTDDEAQYKVDDLARAIKLNWLGRGRVGRIRRGFVSAKVKPDPELSTATESLVPSMGDDLPPDMSTTPSLQTDHSPDHSTKIDPSPLPASTIPPSFSRNVYGAQIGAGAGGLGGASMLR